MKLNIWEVVKGEDGAFNILHNGELLSSSIPDRWLEDQLAGYGFCGQEYRDILHQLDQSGKATMIV